MCIFPCTFPASSSAHVLHTFPARRKHGPGRGAIDWRSPKICQMATNSWREVAVWRGNCRATQTCQRTKLATCVPYAMLCVQLTQKHKSGLKQTDCAGGRFPVPSSSRVTRAHLYHICTNWFKVTHCCWVSRVCESITPPLSLLTFSTSLSSSSLCFFFKASITKTQTYKVDKTSTKISW